jgi:hypothetical protein
MHILRRITICCGATHRAKYTLSPCAPHPSLMMLTVFAPVVIVAGGRSMVASPPDAKDNAVMSLNQGATASPPWEPRRATSTPPSPMRNRRVILRRGRCRTIWARRVTSAVAQAEFPAPARRPTNRAISATTSVFLPKIAHTRCGLGPADCCAKPGRRTSGFHEKAFFGFAFPKHFSANLKFCFNNRAIVH